MIFIQVGATIALLIVNSVGPGLVFIRHMRWRPMESLCGSVALSFLLLYLATFVIYILQLPPVLANVPTGFAVAATLICLADLRRLWRHRETRATILAFFALFAWILLLLLLVRNYSGANWFGDWFEHYERTLFFSEHKPLDTRFLNNQYTLPARPPMMNVLTAGIFWQVTPSFDLFQVVFAYLNALVIIPCALIAPSLVTNTRHRAWLIAAVLALNPMFVENATYTWTKAFAAFYQLTALGLYLSAWRRNDLPRMVAAFACLATAMVIHYSAAPLVLFLGGHYLFLFRKRRSRWREIVLISAISAAIFLSWLAWSLFAYGAKETFASNTAVTASQQLSVGGNASKIGQNVYYSLVPFFMRGSYDIDATMNPKAPPLGLTHVRDWCFLAYQNVLPTMLGLAGLILVSWQLVKFFFDPPNDRWQHRYGFWLALTVVVTFVGIAVHGELSYFGVAHVCLQPLALLGLTLAAVGLPHVPRSLGSFALFGLFVDAVFGILIHIHLLHNVFEISMEGSQTNFAQSTEMGWSALVNGLLKFNNNLTFLGDHTVSFASLIETAMHFGVLAICLSLWFLAERSGRRASNSAKVSNVVANLTK